MKFKSFYFIAIFIFFSKAMFPQDHIKTEAGADLVLYTNKEGLPSTNISNMVETKEGYLWISGIEGTYRFDGYEFEEVGEDIGLPKMQNIFYDSSANMMYFASPTKFITFDGKNFKVYGKKEGYKINGLSGQVITFIKADSKGRIWIGSSTPFVDKRFNGGLTKFENGKFTAYDSKAFPLDNAINFIETPYGDLIFNSSGHNTQTLEGAYIALFRNGVFKRIDESVGITLQGANMFSSSIVSPVDKEGNTWIACTGGTAGNSYRDKAGVLMYDGNTFHQYKDFLNQFQQDQYPAEAYYSTDLDKLFLTTFHQNTEKFNRNNKSIFEFSDGKWKPSDIFEKIGSIKNLTNGSVINDFKYSAIIFQKPNKNFPELLAFQVTNQSQSSRYPNQMFYNNKGKWEKFDAFPGFPVEQTKDGTIIATDKGFGIYYPNRSKMLTSKDSLLQTQGGIPTVYTDKNGNVWISFSYTELPAYALTSDVGINVWDGKKLRAITKKDGLSSNITFQFLNDSQKRLWIATAGGASLVREIKNSNGQKIFKIKNIPSGENKKYNTSSFLETGKGDIYTWEDYVRPEYNGVIKSDYFLGKFDGEKFVKINSPFSAEDNKKSYQLIDLREDRKNRLWLFGIFADSIKDITTNRSKIMIFDGKKWSAPPPEWDVPNDQLHYVGKLDNGMYFLTVGGFYVFDGNKFINLSDSVNTHADFRILKGASVAGTKTDIQAGNRLYIRLRNRGLAIFDGTNLNFYTKKEGLPSTNISNPIADDRGYVFFAFPSGALQIKGEDFQTYYDDENVVSGGPFTSVLDGFGNLVELYNGVGLYINKIEDKSYPLKISSVAVNGNYNYYTFPKNLPYSENSLLVNYAALNYKNPAQTNYEHFLQGYDKEWSKAGALAFAEYQNLPYGKYTFRVHGVTANGNKTTEASFSFRIHPPFWRTWWAYCFYAALFGFALVGIRKYEKGKILKREEEKIKEERAAAALKEAQLRAKIAETENERKSKELEEARQLQLSMLPKKLPQLPHLDIAVYMQTATEVGGDYYDFHLHLDGTLTVLLGDATGHGMQSGMMVSIMKSLFMSDRSNKSLKPFFQNTNTAIKDMELGRLMMAANCVQFNSNKIKVASAGMPSVLIYRAQLKLAEEIVINNLPLGAMREFDYEVKEESINSGDTLLLMSDGFAELKNNNNEMIGYKKAKSIFESVAEKNPEEIIRSLKEKADSWAEGLENEDDITFVVVKVK